MATAVLVPLKAFDAAKGRLDGALTDAERADLVRALAAAVIEAAVPLPVWVVCDDDGVADFASARGALVVHQRRAGLNGAVADGVDAITGDGFERVLVAHGDLAHPRGLTAIADVDAEVVIVPDRHGDGTNVLVVPATAGFGFAYGPGSFAAHRAEARRLGLRTTVVEDPELGWDVDTPADLGAITSPSPPGPA